MIKFECGYVENKNATATFGGGDAVDAHAERDADGNVTVTVDTAEPDHGVAVELVLHDENDGRYAGAVSNDDGVITLKA